MKKVIGVLFVVLSLPFFTVGGLAAANMPVPFLGPMLGYNPSAGSSSSSTSTDFEDDFYTDDDLFGDQDLSSSSGDNSGTLDGIADDVIYGDDDDTVSQPVTSETASEFMKALEVVASTELFRNRFTFIPANYIDGDYVATVRFPDDSEFTVTESQANGIYIENVFSIQSSITADEYDILTDREAHMAYVYETVMQALGKNVGVGAEEYNTLIADNPLFPVIEAEPLFDTVKSNIASKTLSSDNFNLTLTDLVPDEFFISGRLLLSLKNSTLATIQGQPSSSQGSEASPSSGESEAATSSQPEETSSSTGEEDAATSTVNSSSSSASSEGQAEQQDGQDPKNNPRAGNRALQGS